MRNIRTCSFLALSAITFGLAGAASAQTLSLTPSSAAAAPGVTVTFTVFLNPATGGSANLFEYDANLFVNSTYLQFVGSAPFTPSAVSLADFPNTENTTNTITQAGGMTDLRLTYDNNNSNASVTTPTALGTFSVTTLAALPAAGTQVLFGAADTGSGPTANAGGSEVLANFGTEVLTGVSGATLRAAAPEPSQAAALGLGVLGLAGLAWRKRRVV